MSVGFVNISSGATVVGGTSLQLNLPAPLFVGDFMLAFGTFGSADTPSWPAGWTAIGAGFCAYRFCDGTEVAGPTVSFLTSDQLGWIAQWTGMKPVIGATNDNQNTTGTSASNTGVTTTANLSYVISLAIEGANAIPSLPTGFTADNSASTGVTVLGGYRLSHKNMLASGSATGTISSTITSSRWRSASIELQLLPGIATRDMSPEGRSGSR